MFLPQLIMLAGLFASTVAAIAAEGQTGRAPVHPRRNVEEFATVQARYLRFTISRTNRGEPCLDEWEIYGPDDPSKNLALADSGTRVAASGTLPDYRIHALRHVNDGIYGNAHSWICDQASGWVELEFADPRSVNRMVWSRDRLGKFTDRLATDYRIEVAMQPGDWKVIASSADRPPLQTPEVQALHPFTESAFATTAEPAAWTGPAAREYVLETWKNVQGLPGNRVTAIVQTPDLWLWVGTANGLARFDGVRFRAFGEQDGLPGVYVSCLYVDVRGVIWVATDAGLARWERGRFVSLAMEVLPPEGPILALTEDATGTLWAATNGGLYAMEEQKFRRKAAGAVSCLLRDQTTGGVWFIRDARLQRWTNGREEIVSAGAEPSRFGSMRTAAVAGDGSVWFGGANEYIGRFADEKVMTFAEGHSVFTTVLQQILPATNGDIWLGAAGSGLARLRAGKVLSVGSEDGLLSNHIASLCEDHEGNIWVGGNDGLTRISPRRSAAITVNDGLSHSVITSVVEDSAGTLWIGTNGGGLNRWRDGKAEPVSPSYVLDNEIIAALCSGKDGSLWIGTARSGLAHLDGQQVAFHTAAHGLPRNAVSALALGADGSLWIGTSGGAVKLHPGEEPGSFEKVPEVEVERITTLASDGNGRIWFGTAGKGILMRDAERWTGFSTSEGIASNIIRAMCVGPDQSAWFATNAGITRILDGKVRNYSVAHGLLTSVISQVVTDAEGNLWMGTNRGIARISRESLDAVASDPAARLDIVILDKSDGLPALECTSGYPSAALRLNDGRLCFGTIGGMAILDPTRFSPSPNPPKAVIESVAFGREPALHVEGLSSDPEGKPTAKFHFTALSYTAPHRIRFRYRLEGLQDAWVESGPERSASYENLPGGSYRFVVHAGADAGRWSEASIAFSVPSPWWRTFPAIAMGAMGGIACVAATARYVTRRRLQRRLREVEQKLAVERERTRIARDIHDQLGANLTHIALLSATPEEVQDERARERLRAIASTSNELIQSVDAIVWAVNPRHSTVESLARYLSRFSADFLAPAGVRLRLDVPVDLPDVQLSPEMRHNLYLACREVLNNAVRHGRPTEIKLSIKVASELLVIVISDNGRGFVEGEAPAGEGLENIRRRLTDNGGTCEISSLPGAGTTVTFTIPLRTI